MDENRQERKLTTILSADVVGYSKLMSGDESATLRALKKVRREIVEPRLALHRGHTVKLLGDGSLIEFSSVVDALRFAVDVQHAVVNSQSGTEEESRIRFRIGINIGDVIVEDDDIFGDGVNIAARIEGLADPDGICVSRSVYEHVAGKLDLDMTSMGPQRLKNIPAEIEVFRVELNERSRTLATSAPPVVEQAGPAPGTNRLGAKAGILAAVVGLLIGAAVYWFAVATPDERQSPVVAVLPFQDDSAEDHRGLLGDLVSDGVLAHLARYPELTVIARGSSFRFRGDDRDLKDIGAQLNAKYIVEGSLHFDGSRVTINSALVEVENNSLVWSDRIATDVDNLESVIADVGGRVAYQVEGVIGAAEIEDAGPTASNALLMTQMARKQNAKGLSKENNAAVIALNRRTLELYPEAVWGHLAMAFALRTHVRFGWADDPEAMLAEAIEHGETAVAIAPENYSAHFALGRVRLQAGDHLQAIKAFETALKLNPSSADTMNAYAQAFLYLGENERAIDILEKSERIDPLPSRVHSWLLAWVLWQDGRCEEAEAAFARMAVAPPPAQKLGSVIQTCLGNAEAAREALETYRASAPDWTPDAEAEAQRDVWVFDEGRERWLQNLADAATPVAEPNK